RGGFARHATQGDNADTIARVPTVASIVQALAERTRPEHAAPWDPVGLQLGDLTAQADSVAVCHEVTEEVVATLEKDPVDLLVTYHPLLFEPVNRIVAGRSPSARAFRLLGAGVSLVVIHTDFDAAPGGTADALAARLQLRDIEPFGADEMEATPAIGRVGGFELTLDALESKIAEVVGSNGLRVSGDRARRLDRVAVIPGSGSDFIERAAEVADALVTGDVSHHRTVHAADLGLAVVDPGHIATERPGMGALVALVADVVGRGVVDLTDLDPETWS
ncbi:MAG: Nif3-like dinuclear metal center hexameric protein, partial [Acidimicrobiia bacterium]